MTHILFFVVTIASAQTIHRFVHFSFFSIYFYFLAGSRLRFFRSWYSTRCGKYLWKFKYFGIFPWKASTIHCVLLLYAQWNLKRKKRLWMQLESIKISTNAEQLRMFGDLSCLSERAPFFSHFFLFHRIQWTVLAKH